MFTPTPTPTPTSFPFLVIAICVATLPITEADLQCKKIHEIYSSGTDLCETMWGSAFTVVPDTASGVTINGNTMGFYDANNPNTQFTQSVSTPWQIVIVTGSVSGTTMTVTTVDSNGYGGAKGLISVGNAVLGTGIPANTMIQSIDSGSGGAGTYTLSNSINVASSTLTITGQEYQASGSSVVSSANGAMPTCNIQYFHYAVAVQQTDGDYRQCVEYNEASCCSPDKIKDFDSINQAYGPEYHIDRCGPMSDACKEYFMKEACLYECDPNAGLYRKYSQAEYEADPNTANLWQIEGMPIRQGFCDNWYRACYNDYFCGGTGGDYFECAKIYTAPKTKAEVWTQELTTITACVTVFGVLILGALGYVVWRERQGKALFQPLAQEYGSSSEETVPSAANNRSLQIVTG